MASIEQRGDVWRARVRRHGQTITKTVDTEAQAIAWAKAEEKRIISGETAASVKDMPSGISVAALFERYAKLVSPEKGGARWEAIRLAAMAKAFPGAAVDLDGPALAEWRDKRLATVSGATVNRELNLISAVFTRAQKEWRLPITANPVAQIQRPKHPQGREWRISDDEISAITLELGWDMVSEPTDLNELVAWAFNFAISTAMRKSEILGMRWQYVHADRKFVHLPKTKNGTTRDVPLSPKALSLIGLLRPGRAGEMVIPLQSGTCDAYFRKATRGACLNGLHFHDSRHEATSRLALKINNPLVLAKIIGHKDIKMVMRYYHPDAEGLASMLD